MAKRILDSLDGVPADLAKEYKQNADGKFVLQVDEKDAEDVTALKNAKEHEKNLRVAAENKIATIEAEKTTLAEQLVSTQAERDAAVADKGKDVQALETSWKEKVEAEKTARTTETTALQREVERLLVTNTAIAMANEISTVPELFQDVIAKRLKVEKGADEQYFTRVLDAAGSPSAATVDDLKKELLANDKYAAIIISGKGSGGGAGGSNSGGGAGEKKWLEYSDEELVELRKSDPEKYDRLKQAYNAEQAR